MMKEAILRARRRRPEGSLRRLALVLHRWVGLAISVFLIVAGLTGAALAFYRELDAFVNPELYELPPEEQGLDALDPFEVNRRIEAKMPAGMHFRSLRFAPEPGRSVTGWVEERAGVWREFFVSPRTGRFLGSRVWGAMEEGKKNLLPFLYRLHFSLGLGEVGTLLFGLVSLLWTLDCFVSLFLTFPASSPHRGASGRGFLQRWLPAWQLRTNKLFSLVFSWHRASGLWIWALLLVFAWSAVGLNLRPVYAPVMRALVGLRPEGHEALPQLSRPFPEPRLSLHQAVARGREELQREARERGFIIRRELGLDYASDHGVFAFSAETSLDISRSEPRTEVYIDGQSGRFVGFSAPTGIALGNTLSSWLLHLHRGAVFGLGYRVVVAFVGLAVAMLSATGIWIWWRKRLRRRGRARCDESVRRREHGKELDQTREPVHDGDAPGAFLRLHE